jgi:hypothetical protein
VFVAENYLPSSLFLAGKPEVYFNGISNSNIRLVGDVLISTNGLAYLAKKVGMEEKNNLYDLPHRCFIRWTTGGPASVGVFFTLSILSLLFLCFCPNRFNKTFNSI